MLRYYRYVCEYVLREFSFTQFQNIEHMGTLKFLKKIIDFRKIMSKIWCSERESIKFIHRPVTQTIGNAFVFTRYFIL